MAGTLRDDLASLRIERRTNGFQPAHDRRPSAVGGARFLSFLLWLIPLGIVGGGGYFIYRQYESFRPKVEVTVGQVQLMTSGEAEKLLSAKGYIKSRNQAMIGAKAAGRVERMLVEEGSRVKKGQLLAVLEHNDVKRILESRRMNVKRTEAELLEARADLKEKERLLRRKVLLRQHNVAASAEELELAETGREKASARVVALEAGVNLQNAMAGEIEEMIHNMNILAPFDGTVVAQGAEVGETITPGGMGAASGRGSVVTLANLDQLEVETDITETLLSRVAMNQPAEVSVSAVPNKHYRGKLRQIIPLGDRTRGTVKVKVEILDPDSNLFPELAATVHFLPDKSVDNPNAGRSFLFVSKAAILEEAGHSYVWTIDEKSVVHRKRVEVATSTDDLVRVESGLKSGESVVLNPAKTLKENEIVKKAE